LFLFWLVGTSIRFHLRVTRRTPEKDSLDASSWC